MLLFATVALAAPPPARSPSPTRSHAGEVPIPALKTATATFAATSLGLVARIGADGKTYDLKCATLPKGRTCTLSLWDTAGQEEVVARSTTIVCDAGDGFNVSAWDTVVPASLRTIVLAPPR